MLRLDLGERSYAITIGAGVLERAGELLAPLVPLRRTVIVTDENLARTRHPARLAAALERGRDRQPHHRAAAGEATKSWASSSAGPTTCWRTGSSGARRWWRWAAG